MKKKILCSFILLGISCLLVGCGNKQTVTCTMEQKQTGMNQSQTIKGHFKGNKVTDVDMKVEVDIDDQYKSYVDQMYKTLETEFKKLEQDGITLDMKKSDSKITVNIKMDANKVKDENGLGLDTKSTPDEMIKEFEDQGYKCSK